MTQTSATHKANSFLLVWELVEQSCQLKYEMSSLHGSHQISAL